MIETIIGQIADPLQRFFAFCRERENIRLRRAARQPKPWTDDPVIQQYKFTNIYRELDRTTLWFAKYVRGPLCDKPEVLLATVIFRWFNRISTGEAVFCQTEFAKTGISTAFGQFQEDGDLDHLRRAILAHCGAGPYITGAYIIQTRGAPPGLSKLDGVLYLIGLFYKRNWRNYKTHSLEQTSRWLQESPSMGPFMAYEVVTDLRWTALLEKAPDIDTWANAGPGAMRGLNRLAGRDLKADTTVTQQLSEMRGLLTLSREAKYWLPDWQPWELREVEHSLCEFDKYERTRTGQGRPRGNYA